MSSIDDAMGRAVTDDKKMGFFMEFAINEKATCLQVTENMPEMMQLKKSNSRKTCKNKPK